LNINNSFLVKNLILERLAIVKPLLFLALIAGPFNTQAQEYLYGLAQKGGYYDMGVAYQISTTGEAFLGYGHFDGVNGGNPGHGAGFIQMVHQDALVRTLSAMTMAGDQNFNHGMRVDIEPGQGGLLPPYRFMFSEDGTGFNPGGKFLLASNGLLYGLTSSKGQFDGGSLFYASPFNGPNQTISFDGISKGKSPKGSLIQGPEGLLFGMTEFGGTNNLGVIFSFNIATAEFKKIHDFRGTATGANPTGSLILASDGKLYGMTRAGGTSGNGVIFQIDIHGNSFTKLVDLNSTTGTDPRGSLIQHPNGNLYGMTSAGGNDGFGTIFSLTTGGVFNKLVDFNGSNGKSPVGDLVIAPTGQAMYGVTYSGGASDKGVMFKLENGNEFTRLYDFSQSTGSNPVGSLMMIRKYPEMTFPDMPQKTTTDPAFTPDIQTSSALPIYLVSSDPTVAVIENNQIKIIGSGGVSITAYQVGNHEYLPRSITKTLSVVKTDQTIDFPPIPARIFGDAPFSLTASSSSGLPVTFAFSGDVISFDGTKFSIKNAGTITVRAVQQGSTIYNSAETTRELIVNRADQTIVFNLPAEATCCQTFTLSASTSSGLKMKFKTANWEKLSISESLATIEGLGPVQITAYNDGSRNYNPSELSRIINLQKGIQFISFFVPNDTYRFGQSDLYLNTSSTSGLPVTYTSNPPGIAVVAGSLLRFIGVGTTTITATQDGNNLMGAAFPISQTVTVAPPLTAGPGNTITFEDLSYLEVNTAPFNLIAKATSGLPVSFQSSNTTVAEIAGNLIIIKGAGSTTITASQTGNATVPAAAPVQRSLQVMKRYQNISLEYSLTMTFGISPIPMPTRSSGNLPLSYSTSDASIAYVDEDYFLHVVSSGNVTITASQPGNVVYNASDPASSQIKITPLQQQITFSGLPMKAFGDSPFALSAIASSGLPVEFISSNTEIATIDGSTIHIVGAGKTTITAKQNGYPGYNAAVVSRELIVNKGTQVVTLLPLPEKNFTDDTFSISATSSVGMPVTFSSSNPTVASVEIDKITILGPGTIEIIATQAGNENYHPAEVRQQLKITDARKTFDLIGSTWSGGTNNSGIVFSLKSDGTGFSSLKDFAPRPLSLPMSGLIKSADGRMYGNFQYGGSGNYGAIVRLESDGTDMTVIHSYNATGGFPEGNILQASDGDLYGMTRTGGAVSGGTIFKVKADGSGYTILRELSFLDGINTSGGLTEAENGKLYGMTNGAGFFNLGTIFSVAKDGSDFQVIFRFNESAPIVSGYNARGDLTPGMDGYLYGTLAQGGDNGRGVLFKIKLDGSNFTKIINFDGASYGTAPGASVLIGSDGKIYGLTGGGGSANQGTLFVVNRDGSGFMRLFNFDGTITGGGTICKLTEGSDGMLYGTAYAGGANSLGTVFKIGKNGGGFQKLADLNSLAAAPMFGPLVESEPGKFFGMAANGGPENGGGIFSITSSGALKVVSDILFEESNPSKLVGDKTGEFYFGVAQSGKPSLFRITDSGQYERIFEIPSGVVVWEIFHISTGHIWCFGTKNTQPYLFRIKTDGTGFEEMAELVANLPSFRNIEWLTERLDGKLFGVTTRGTIDNPGMMFTVQNDGTGYSEIGLMPKGKEFGSASYLYASDGIVYAIGLYDHTLHRYDGDGLMKIVAVLPEEIGQVPMKLIELNGGRIGVAMRSEQIFSVNKDGSQYTKIIDQTYELGASPSDMIQSFDGWIYVSATMGGAHDKGVIYKVLGDGSSYTVIRDFKGEDGNIPNSILFKKLVQTLTFEPIAPKTISDPAFKPVATTSSGARIQFTSSNPAVAVIDDGKIKPVGGGKTTITASVPVNANYYAVTEIQRELIVDKGDQAISFTNPGSRVVGNAPFELSATATSGLGVTFEATSSNVTISGSTATLIRAGVANIKATQAGDASYYPADPVELSFCINPSKPSIITSGALPNKILTSSNNEGNQWYRNNNAIDGATGITLSPDESGIYTVISTVEGCSSTLSEPYELVITGIEKDPDFTFDIFPNPTKDIIHVRLNGYMASTISVVLLDTFGRIVDAKNGQDRQFTLDLSNQVNGLYIVKVTSGRSVETRKVVKE
jgi:uncharacterized repeat protein (TIGR03803 family)